MTMVARSTSQSPGFRLVAKGLVELHQMVKRGADESPEAESVRDALDGPLKALNRTEKERAQWLSEDLYSVSDPSPANSQKPMDGDAQRNLNEAFEARQNGDADRALFLLRKYRDYISPPLLSYLRGSIWLARGNPEVAEMFYEDAAARDPTNGNYKAIYLRCLNDAHPSRASIAARQVLDNAESNPTILVAQAADIHFKEIGAASDAEAAGATRKLIPILERNAERIETDGGAASAVSAYTMTIVLLGFCHEILGRNAEALRYYDRGLQMDPDNDGLLAARGILQYGSGQRGIADLERAAELRTPLIWPYLLLAHHSIVTKQFYRGLAMCQTALRMRGSDAAKSQIEDWRAIAQAEIGFPPEMVRAGFEAAIRLDPSNDFAKRNRAMYEAALAANDRSGAIAWQQNTESMLRQSELAERRYAASLRSGKSSRQPVAAVA